MKIKEKGNFMQLQCDVHTHTLYSRHAYSTILENVHAAKEAGLELLGSTDHFSSMLYPEYDNIRHYQYLCVSHTWPKEIEGVRLLQGCEVDIVDLEGNLFGYDIPIAKNIDGDFYSDGKVLSLYERVTRKMDYVIASVHRHGFADAASPLACTKLYLSALQHKKVLILGHSGRSGLPFEIDPVLLAAKEAHKLIEINNHSMDSGSRIVDRCRQIALRCAELSVPISVSSDAHFALRIGQLDAVKKMLSEIHFPEELIATRTKDSFLDALKKAGLS